MLQVIRCRYLVHMEKGLAREFDGDGHKIASDGTLTINCGDLHGKIHDIHINPLRWVYLEVKSYDQEQDLTLIKTKPPT